MATPINTTSAPLDTKDPGATRFSLEMETDSGVANTTVPAIKKQKRRKIPVNGDEDLKRPDEVSIKDEFKSDGDVPTWNPDRKEKKALSVGANTAPGKGKTAAVTDETKDEVEVPTSNENTVLPAGASTAPGKGKAAVVKDEADDEDDEDWIIAVFGPDTPNFSGSDTITLAVKIKFEEFVNTKPVPAQDRVQITAPFDFDPSTARGTQPDKEISYHGQATAYVLSAARDPQHNFIKISHLNF
ncbi:hypothetical protein LTR17_012307 [Elasticomyces elasticus]|nr:hypothetical protein LTR17_012307 [Elasticomyces elasticus]